MNTLRQKRQEEAIRDLSRIAVKAKLPGEFYYVIYAGRTGGYVCGGPEFITALPQRAFMFGTRQEARSFRNKFSDLLFPGNRTVRRTR